MSIVKDVNVNGKTVFDTNKLLVYLADNLKTGGGKYVVGLGFITDNYLDEFQAVKVANQKTTGRQFRQITIAPSPAGKKLSPEDYLKMGTKIAEFYYDQGFQVIIVFHNDTDTPHLHLMINSVNFGTGKMFSQSISGLNRFKSHCNTSLVKYGLDPIGKPAEMLMDTVVHEMSEGFDCLELFDEIMADKASSLSDLYKEPVAEHQPLYTPEYTVGDCIVCEPTKTRNYFNPDAPKPWAKIIFHPDGSWGIPMRPLDEFDMSLLRYMRPEEQQRILSFSSQRPCYGSRQISGKEFAANPNYFLDARLELNIIVESFDELEQVISARNAAIRMAEAEKAYNTKLGVATLAQFNQLGINANVTTDVSTKVNITFKGKEKTAPEDTSEVIDIPCKDNK